MKTITTCIFVFALLFGSCSGNKQTQKEKDIEEIKEYLNDNNLEADSTASGLYYIIEKKGSGPKPTDNSTVTVEYTGKLTNGEIFDEGLETFTVKDLIPGWQEGLKLFQQGGRGMLLIPSELGYGDKKTGQIPPNSVLIFEMDLIYVEE
ncbi:MAG: FKBP-type peptidyl-prolyl cis-trans isomerase [Bacteroidales bacterium]